MISHKDSRDESFHRVANILDELELGKYFEVFKEEEIDYNAFLLLDDNSLKGLNIPTGPRVKIMSKIESIKDGGTSSNSNVNTPPTGHYQQSVATQQKVDQAKDIYDYSKASQLHWEIDPSEVILGEKIGEGEFGAVFKAQWRNATVVVKTLTISGSQSITDSQLEIWKSEWKILSHLRPHFNVIQFLGSCSQVPNLFLIYEYLHCGDLGSILQNNANLPLYPDKLRMMIDISSGMAHLHKEGILHRDLATRNMLVTRDSVTFHYRVKVGDFGLSKVAGTYESSTGFGPLRWMSPEAIDPEKRIFSTKSDVWSYGVVCWEILSNGELPLKELPGTVQAGMAILAGKRLELPKGIPKKLAEIIQTCWKDDPEERPTFAELFVSLTLLLSDLQSSESESVVQKEEDEDTGQGNDVTDCTNSNNSKRLSTDDEGWILPELDHHHHHETKSTKKNKSKSSKIKPKTTDDLYSSKSLPQNWSGGIGGAASISTLSAETSSKKSSKKNKPHSSSPKKNRHQQHDGLHNSFGSSSITVGSSRGRQFLTSSTESFLFSKIDARKTVPTATTGNPLLPSPFASSLDEKANFSKLYFNSVKGGIKQLDVFRSCIYTFGTNKAKLFKLLTLIEPESGQTVIHVVAQSNLLEHMQLVLAVATEKMLYEDKKKLKAVLDFKDKLEWSPLHCSCSERHWDMSDLLIKAGASTCNMTTNGSTPLHYVAKNATLQGSHCVDIDLKRIETLIGNILDKKEISVDVRNYQGETPLHLAVLKGELPIVRLFLNLHSDVHLKTKRGETCLHYACQEVKKDIVQELLKVGVDPTATALGYGTALDLVIKLGHPKDLTDLLEQHMAKAKQTSGAASTITFFKPKKPNK